MQQQQKIVILFKALYKKILYKYYYNLTEFFFNIIYIDINLYFNYILYYYLIIVFKYRQIYLFQYIYIYIYIH